MEKLPRRRRRPALSCLECRRRKIKCNREEPCAHCVSAKTHCSYKFYDSDSVIQRLPRSPSAYVPSPIAESRPTAITHVIRESESSPEARLITTALEIPNVVSNSTPRERVSPVNHAHAATNHRSEATEYSQAAPSPSASGPVHPLSDAARNILLLQHGLQDSNILLNKTRTLRWSNWTGAAEEPVANGKAAGCQSNEVGSATSKSAELYEKCKAMAKTLKLSRPSRSLAPPEFDWTPPSREVADSMATLYSQSFESAFRVLHMPTFWAEYQAFWSNPEGSRPSLRLKVLLVVGIGSSLSTYSDTDDSFRRIVHHWIYAAQSWLSGPLEKDRLDIAGLQIHCLIMIARQIFSIGGDLVWVSMGSIIHRAMQIGLHRDPENLPKMSQLKAEVRRRLWATIVELAVQSSLDSAMPPRISLDEFDTEPPSNFNDDDLDESTPDIQPHSQTTFTSTSLQLLLHESLPIRLQMLQRLNSLHSELSYLDILALSSQVMDAYQISHAFMIKNADTGVTPFNRNLVDFLLRRFMIPLHCAYATQARKNPLFHYSMKVSLETAIALISPEPDASFSRLMTLAGGMFREGLRYASAIIGLELIAQVEHQRRDGTLSRNAQYVAELKRLVQTMISLALQRIQQGETNIKNHVFLNMILGQVEAMEEGSPPEPKMAECGRDSLQICHDILLARIEKMHLGSSSRTMFTPVSFDSGQGDYGFNWDLDFFMSDAGFT